MEARADGSNLLADVSLWAAGQVSRLGAEFKQWLGRVAPAIPNPLSVRGSQTEENPNVVPAQEQAPEPEHDEEEETMVAEAAPMVAPAHVATAEVANAAGTPGTIEDQSPIDVKPVRVTRQIARLPEADIKREDIAPATVRVAEAPKVTLTTPEAAPFTQALSVAQGKARQRLRDNLSKDLFANFDLFLYVSKSASGENAGPLAQRAFVMKKEGNDLRLLHDWPVSTGREKVEYNTGGERLPSFTPAGYYQLDSGRFYQRYRSSQWGASMPFSMFFNWINEGNETGLAIHGAGTPAEIALLGQRASAGCVRLSPENAELLFRTIKANYRGDVPRFVYDRKSMTMSNRGELARDAKGNLRYQDGYKVLVVIEDYDGKDDGSVS